MTDRTKVRGLLGLMVLWASLFSNRWFAQDEPKRASLKFQTGQVAQKDTGTRIERGVRRPSVAFHEPRNIFASLSRSITVDSHPPKAARRTHKADPVLEMPAPPPAPDVVFPPAEATPSPSPEDLAALEAARRQEALVQEARQLLNRYRFIGYVSQAGEQRAFVGRGKDLYIVGTGDTLDDVIRVARIDNGAIQLLHTATRLATIIPLTKDADTLLATE